MNHNDLKSKIREILENLRALSNEKADRIWSPSSTARDYFGFSQKHLEKIIRGKNLIEEIEKFNSFLGNICSNDKNSELFIHVVSRSILFKKRENIRGGIDIRVINILPSWLIILEKLSMHKIKELLTGKINMMQYGFVEGGDCNIAKFMIWYHAKQEGLSKHLLIDIKKAFDSIDRIRLRNFLREDFRDEQLSLLINFIDIYDTIEIEVLGDKIYPTKGGPQGSAIVPIFFIYYLDKSLKKLNLNEETKLQAYAYDLVIQSKSIENLYNVYFKIKEALRENNLIINPEKCEILSDNPSDKIIDDQAGIDILPKSEVKYLGQNMNSEGLAEQIIEDRLFGNIKNKLNKYDFLTRLTRIRIFKAYMVSKVNHLLPLISLNGHLGVSWKCIRRIIFRKILKTQTSPLEGVVSLGLGFFNIIIKPILRNIERGYIFFFNNSQLEFLKKAAVRALIHWKSLEQKIPSEL